MAVSSSELPASSETPAPGGPGPGAEEALARLLSRYPTATVAAVGGDLAPTLVGLPDAIGLQPGHQTVDGPSLLDPVSPEARAVVAKLWGRARTEGAAMAPIRIGSEPPRNGILYFVDLRERLGVIVGVFAEGETVAEPELLSTIERPSHPARFARIYKDGAAVYIGADPAIEEILGWPPSELIGQRAMELIHPDDRERAIEAWVRMLDFPGPTRPVRLRHRHKGGHWVWIEITNHNRLDQPAYHDVAGEIVDISEEIAAREAARARQQLLEQLTETLPIGLFHADLDGRILFSNQRFEQITGLRAGALLGEWPALSGEPGRALVADALEVARGGTGTATVIEGAARPAEHSVRSVLPGGVHRARSWCFIVRPLSDQSGAVTGVTGSVEDVTDSVAERRELEVRAATDSLTGCLNKAATIERLEEALAALGPSRSGGVALTFVDIDGLKDLNDSSGHLAGDALLIEVANRIRSAITATDVVGRFGGDEFVVISPGVVTAGDALALARDVAAGILRPFRAPGSLSSVDEVKSIEVRASLGVAWAGEACFDAPTMIRRADAAMYRSKHEGRCQPVMAEDAG